jgi:hypothetical protein
MPVRPVREKHSPTPNRPQTAPMRLRAASQDNELPSNMKLIPVSWN